MDGLTAVISPSDTGTPTYANIWRELCDNAATDTPLYLAAPLSNANCAALADITLADPACEGVIQHGSTDGVSGPTASEHPCSHTCALLWARASARCGHAAAFGATTPARAAAACEATATASTVLDEKAAIQFGQTRDFTFEAVSGTRYEVGLRVGEGTGEAALCTDNSYDNNEHDNTCDDLISSSQYSCAVDFCATCGQFADYCNHACGILCVDNGVVFPGLSLLPPGATHSGQVVAADTKMNGGDKDLGFTATTTGTYTAQIFSNEGSGPITLSVIAVGTALERLLHLQADALPHPLSVSCHTKTCTFGYDGKTAVDGDGSGFDLVLPDAEAGRAYAFLVELPASQTAAQIEATFYQPGAAAGAAGFTAVLSAPMGKWTSTPAGHESYAERKGCSNNDEDRSTCINVPDSFGIHPGDTFGRFVEGTWVAPSSGPVLLRLVLNCDVAFYADADAEGCHIDLGIDYGCDPTSDGINHSTCSAELHLTVTPGAYYDPATRRRLQKNSGSHIDDLTIGIARRTDTVVIGRVEIEAQAAAVWYATHDAGRRLQASGESPHPPTLEDMLVDDTEANRLLISLFTVEEEPHVVYPLSMQLDDSTGHRRLQMRGDRLVVVIDTHAPSPFDADKAEQRLIDRVPGAGRTEPHGIGSCNLAARAQAVNYECCDEPSEDCSSGRPATCNVGCAAVVLPFFDDCSAALGTDASYFDAVVALCHAALDGQGKRRRLQMSGDHLHHTIETHAVCGLGSTEVGCTADGQTKRQTRLVIGRADVEAQAAVLWQSQHTDVGRRLQMQRGHLMHPIGTHAPTLDEMLLGGTPANALLSRVFIDEQQPQVAYPTSFALEDDNIVSSDGKHRRLQMGGGSLIVTIDTHAATPAEAERIVRRLTPPPPTDALVLPPSSAG
jgi:hypothetical protein